MKQKGIKWFLGSFAAMMGLSAAALSAHEFPGRYDTVNKLLTNSLKRVHGSANEMLSEEDFKLLVSTAAFFNTATNEWVVRFKLDPTKKLTTDPNSALACTKNTEVTFLWGKEDQVKDARVVGCDSKILP